MERIINKEKMLSLAIKEIRKETSDTKTFFFDVPPYSWQYAAGQFVTAGKADVNDSLREKL